MTKEKTLAQTAGEAIESGLENSKKPEYQEFKKKDIEKHKKWYSYPLLDEERFLNRQAERGYKEHR